MKYKIGDKVKIRKDLEVGQLFGTCFITPNMYKLRGEIVHITEVNEHYGEYRISPYPCWWTDEMFEDGVDMETQKKNKRIVIYADGNKVFDFYIGAKLAFERLEDAEKPYGWLKEGAIYYVPEITDKDLYGDYIYAEDEWDKMVMERGLVFKTKEEAIECAKRMLEVVKQEV